MRLIPLNQLEQFTAINVLSDPGAVGGKVKIPQAAQVVLKFTLTDGKTAAIVLYGRYVGAFTIAQVDVTAAFNAFKAGSQWTGLATHIAPSTSFTGVDVRNVNEVDQPIISSSGTGAPGTSTGTALPDEVSLCITLKTGFAGKSGQGRAYFPGWATTALGAGGTPATAAVTALQTWASANIPSGMQAMAFTHCLGLRERQAYVGTTGTSHPARPATTRDVVSYLVRAGSWDTQRRRGLR